MNAAALNHLRQLGETIRLFRTAAGMSQQEMADASGLAQSEVSRLERGATEPGLTKLVQLARFFEVPLDSLLDGIEDIKPIRVDIGASVTCEEHGLLGAGLTAERARQVRAEHRRQHLVQAPEDIPPSEAR